MRPRFPSAVLRTSVGTSRRSLSLIACDVCRPFSSLLDQFDGLMVPRSGRFDHHRIENVAIRRTTVLIGLVGSCMFCRRSCFPGWIGHVSIGKSVRYGDVPYQGFSSRPWQNSCTVWSVRRHNLKLIVKNCQPLLFSFIIFLLKFTSCLQTAICQDDSLSGTLQPEPNWISSTSLS